MKRVRQLKNEGREFIGREVIGTVKRDGENVSIFYDSETDSLPLFAKMVSVEGAEHNFEPRKDLFKYYLDSLAPKPELATTVLSQKGDVPRDSEILPEDTNTLNPSPTTA